MNEMLSLVPENMKKIEEIYDVDFEVDEIINKINNEEYQNENSFSDDIIKNNDNNDHEINNSTNKCK